ncbi:hypothetical protein [Natronobacterium gregoryi]|uniref:Uncharacterized protein n=3 Tax=Natronobacterium gregoryi TaxID=44930 RepID=L0AIA1_NATGS|nr:hypothetical protein [Natronobacterium gregoryi]AFZ73598.1 hypothetical protein Natgr_2430 [Natronobacterium gregoryi SP2]ELY67878.1 hypothetical protein C490_10300 [Natronobacterium gregoryi SP2]PLK20015.1 hypothetical protein CYV19_11900 [Natronobacterium gregoryi SP2]SFJ34697.1 hypothetical protein SAMN05443661_12341 [Natronobacterium gregoryi]
MGTTDTPLLGTVSLRDGPDRIPGADRSDIGAGYAGAIAAFVATVLYVGLIGIGDSLGFGVDWTVNTLFAALALPFVVPAAFIVGVVGWRMFSLDSSASSVVAGAVGTVATYVVTLGLVGTLLTVTAILSLSGADPVSAAAFSWGLVYFAFVFTWWVTVPVGCLTGLIYVTVIADG